jgi:hypothetical protein
VTREGGQHQWRHERLTEDVGDAPSHDVAEREPVLLEVPIPHHVVHHKRTYGKTGVTAHGSRIYGRDCPFPHATSRTTVCTGGGGTRTHTHKLAGTRTGCPQRVLTPHINVGEWAEKDKIEAIGQKAQGYVEDWEALQQDQEV